MSRSEPPDLPHDVIERAFNGEPDAFGRFYRRYDPTVRFAVGTRVHRWPTLVPIFEDIVQEVWMELMRGNAKRLRYHDVTRGVPFHRFLTLVSARYGWRIAKRELEHLTEELEDFLKDESWSFLTRLMHADLLDRLVDVIERRLGGTDRELFEGYYVRGERLKDIGATLGMNENATYKRKERLQKKLQGFAEGLLGTSSPGVGPPELMAVVLGLMLALSRSGLGGGT
ncbi:MAG: sigma-70 family RNA polymerase sigma factor [Nannocystaceae bacterium]